MRLLIFLSFSICFSNGFAQKNYYQPAYNTSGSELKAALHLLIANHKTYSYTASTTDVWDMLKETDKDTTNPSNVILLYSGRSVDAAQEYNSGKGWTREHVWAKSRGDFGEEPAPGTDAHHLRPADNSINTTRNNRNFDNCTSCKEIIDEGENTGSKYDQNAWTFEPRDEVKGDVARMLFYMAVRYEGDNGELDLELTETLLDKADKSPLQARLSTLLLWHQQDPVDAIEKRRNRVIFQDFQGNRNPFIDYPDLVNFIWGDWVTWKWNPELSIAEYIKPTAYPNPTTGVINITFEFESLEIVEIATGKTITLSISQSIDISNLPNGVYLIRIKGGQYNDSILNIVKN